MPGSDDKSNAMPRPLPVKIDTDRTDWRRQCPLHAGRSVPAPTSHHRGVRPMIVRPARLSDLPALLSLAQSAGAGLTTLPADPQRLQHRLEWAQKTFAGIAERGDADYLFVLEAAEGEGRGHLRPGRRGRPARTLVQLPGRFAGRCVEEPVDQPASLPTLFLGNDMTGHSELCSLFLGARHREGLNGRLLSKARFLFLAEFRECFGDKVIAEMRGYSDEQGISPFWECLGRHFFKMDFADADFPHRPGQQDLYRRTDAQVPAAHLPAAENRAGR